jgi:uncharacterized protein YndB with AHSA1/START domain
MLNSECLQLTHPPVAKAEMLIRKPVEEVFAAFVDPAITTKFWFTKSSGTLASGQRVRWEWEMYGASTEVSVLAMEPNERIRIAWDGYGEPTTVEWGFTPRADGTTFVSISEEGFRGSGDELVAQALGSTQGFTIVLAGLKALLEHNIDPRLVPDKFPDGLAAP